MGDMCTLKSTFWFFIFAAAMMLWHSGTAQAHESLHEQRSSYQSAGMSVSADSDIAYVNTGKTVQGTVARQASDICHDACCMTMGGAHCCSGSAGLSSETHQAFNRPESESYGVASAQAPPGSSPLNPLRPPCFTA